MRRRRVLLLRVAPGGVVSQLIATDAAARVLMAVAKDLLSREGMISSGASTLVAFNDGLVAEVKISLREVTPELGDDSPEATS